MRALTQYCDLPCEAECVIRDLPSYGRLYSPQADTTGAVIVFVHGGGFVLGDLDTYDSFARYLCTRTALRVVSVDYRLAPGTLPRPWDVTKVVEWVRSSPPQLGAPVCKSRTGGR